MTSKLLAASAATLLLGFAAPAFAQSFTLNGTPVPSDQVDRIQEHCDALKASEMGSASDSGSASTDATASETTTVDTSAASDLAGTSGSTDASAASTTSTSGSTDASGTATSSDASSTEASTTGASTGSGDTSTTPVDFATLDLATINIQACRVGGFVDAAETGATGGENGISEADETGPASGTDDTQGASTSTTTTN